MNINPLTTYSAPSYVSKMISSENGQLFSSALENTIELWDSVPPRIVVERSMRIRDFGLYAGSGNAVVTISKCAVQLWDTDSGKLISEVATHHEISRLTVTPSSKSIALKGDYKFTLLNDKFESSEYEMKAPVFALEFHSANTLFVGNERGFRTFDLVTQKVSGVFESEMVTGNCISMNENLVIASNLRKFQVWDLREKKPLYEISRTEIIHSLIRLGKQENYFVLGQDRNIELWDLRTRALSCSWKAHDDAVYALAADTRVLCSGGPDRKIKRWSIFKLIRGESAVAVPAAPAAAAAAAAALPPPASSPAREVECPLINFALLKLGKELGRGGFGVVYAAEWRNEPVAVKQLLLQQITDDARRDFMKEASLLAGLRHPRVVQLFGISEHSRSLSMVLELMENGSLYKHLHSSDKPDLPKRKVIARDITSGLVYLHGHTPQILHRDLKSLNVLIDANFRAKLSDFGLSSIRTANCTVTAGLFGTPRWIAPELFKGEKASAASDVYSLAITLWELFESKQPFHDVDNNYIVMGQVMSGIRPPFIDTPPSLRPIIDRSWRQIPQERFTADQLLESLNGALK